MGSKLIKCGLVAAAALSCCAVLASAAQANFTSSAGAGIAVTASSSADQLTIFGSVIKCTANKYSGTTVAASTNQVTVTPTYGNCIFGVLPATIDFTGCTYQFTSTSPEAHFLCPAGKRVDVTIFASAASHTANTPICHIFIYSQTVKGNTYANSGVSHVLVGGSVNAIHATEHRTSAVCPGEATEATTSTAVYHVQPGGVTVAPAAGTLRVDP